MSTLTQAAEIVASQQAARDSFRTGVSWGGLAPEAPRVETVEAVAERLEGITARAEAFRKTPRGQLLTAIDTLFDVYPAEASKLRGIYDRNLSLLNGPDLDVPAVGAALAVAEGLSPLNARPVRQALIGMLLEDTARAA